MRTAWIVLVLASLSACANEAQLATGGGSATPTPTTTPYDFAPGALGCTELVEDPAYTRGDPAVMHDPETDRVWLEGEDAMYLIDPEDPACQRERILRIRNQEIAEYREQAAEECSSKQGEQPPDRQRGREVDPDAWDAYRDAVCADATRSP